MEGNQEKGLQGGWSKQSTVIGSVIQIQKVITGFSILESQGVPVRGRLSRMVGMRT